VNVRIAFPIISRVEKRMRFSKLPKTDSQKMAPKINAGFFYIDIVIAVPNFVEEK
jgi:hypothetical protein